jgi:large subunit ribosomal protein L4
MPDVHHYTAAAERKGSYALPADFDGRVNQAVIHQAVRAFRNNQRQGTASTKTRSEVSGGSRKPWRQKGTGRARQGTTRSPLWVGGGVVFGPRPRSYNTKVPRKVRQLARRSALNARANEGAIHVIEALDFEVPKTRKMVALLKKLGLTDKKVLILTKEPRQEVYLSCRNLPKIRVMRYGDAPAYDILWSDFLLVEEDAIGGFATEAATPTRKAKRVQKASAVSKKTTKKVVKKTSATAKTTAARKTTGKKKGGSNA